MAEPVPTWEESEEVIPTWESSTPAEDVTQEVSTASSTDIPTWEDSTEAAPSEEGFRAPRGFAERVDNPVESIKEHGIISNLVKSYFTPAEDFDKQKKENRKATIHTVPAIAQLNETLDKFEALAATGTMTQEQEEQYGRVQDAYGDLYARVDKAYEEGKFDAGGFEWKDLADAWEKDAGGLVAEFLNSVVGTPELMVTPAGWAAVAAKTAQTAKVLGAGVKATKAAEIAGGMTGTALLGGSLTASQSAAEQYAKKGEVDAEEVQAAATLGAVAAPILVGGAKAIVKGGKAVSAANFDRQVKKYTEEAGSLAAEYTNKGLNPRRAVQRAIDETVKTPKLREELAKRHDYISTKTLEERVPDKDVSLEVSNKAAVFLSEKIKPVGKTLDYYLAPISTQLSLKHKGLGFSVQRHDQSLGLRIKHGLDVKERFQNSIKKLPKEKVSKLHHALANRNREGALEMAGTDTDLVDSLKSLFSYLDDVHGEAKVLGMKIGHIEGYYPRRISDYSKYIKAKGYQVSEVQTFLASHLNKKFKLHKKESQFKKTIPIKEARKHFTPDEFDNAMNKFFETRRGAPTIKGASAGQKGRVIDRVSEEDLVKFYDDPIKTLTDYVNTMSMQVQTRKFFTDNGVLAPDEVPRIGDDVLSAETNLIDTSIGRLTRKLLDDGEILPEDIEGITALLHARFVGGSKSPNKISGGIKDLLYSALLGNPISAATQLGDIGAAVYLNDTGSAVKALAGQINNRAKRFTMKEMGLDNLVEELEHLRPTSKILEKALKYGLFKSVDRLGKEVVINASFKKMQKMVKTKEGRVKLHDKYREAFTPEEFTQLMSDIRLGRKSSNLKFMLWHELAKVQPISMSEMPPGYLNNPNGRIFYMLKTFTLKQLDIVRRDSIELIKQGKVKEGTSNLLRHAAILGLANGSVAQVKGWLRGDDEAFDDVVIANIFRNYGLSSYLAGDITSGKLGSAFVNLVIPPYNVIDDVGQAVATGDFMRGSKHIPVVGKPFHLFMEQQ